MAHFRKVPVVLLLLAGVAIDAAAFSGRALSPLRFTDRVSADGGVSIASDGSDFLVVSVAFNVSFPYGTSGTAIFGRFVTSAGVAGSPFYVGAGFNPKAFWTGHHYLVLFQGAGGLAVATIPRDGHGAVSTTTVTTPYLTPSLGIAAWNGRRIMLFYSSKWDVFGLDTTLFLDADGRPVGLPSLLQQPISEPSMVIGDGDGFMILNSEYFQDGYLGRIRRFREQDAVLGRIVPQFTTTVPYKGTLATDGTRVLYIYPLYLYPVHGSDTRREWHSISIGADGTAGVPSPTLFTNDWEFGLDAAFSGSRLIIAAIDYDRIGRERNPFARVFDVDAGGKPGAATSVQLTSDSYGVRVFCNARACVFTFDISRQTVRVVPAEAINPTLRPNEGEIRLDVDDAVSAQVQTAIAAGANGYLAAWNERENGQWQVVASPVAADGRTSEGPATFLGKTDAAPAVMGGTGFWLVAFSDKASRLSADGYRLEETVSTGLGTAMAAAWNGSSGLLVGVDQDNKITSSRYVLSAVVRADGSVGDVHTVFTAPAGDVIGSCALTRDGNGYVLAFSVATYHAIPNGPPSPSYRVYASRLSADGFPRTGASSDCRSRCRFLRGLHRFGKGPTLLGSIERYQFSTIRIARLSDAGPLRILGIQYLNGRVLKSLASDGHLGFTLACLEIYRTPVTLSVLHLSLNGVVTEEQQTAVTAIDPAVACRYDDCAVVFSEYSSESHDTNRAQLLMLRELKPAQPPQSPRRVQLLRNGAASSVVWDLIPDALGYLVEAAGSDGGFRLIAATTADTRAFPLDPGTVSVRVTAWNAAGRSFTAIAPGPGPSDRLALRSPVTYDSTARYARNHGSRRPNFVASAVPMPKTEVSDQTIRPTIGIRRIAPRITTPMTTMARSPRSHLRPFEQSSMRTLGLTSQASRWRLFASGNLTCRASQGNGQQRR